MGSTGRARRRVEERGRIKVGAGFLVHFLLLLQNTQDQVTYKEYKFFQLQFWNLGSLRA